MKVLSSTLYIPKLEGRGRLDNITPTWVHLQVQGNDSNSYSTSLAPSPQSECLRTLLLSPAGGRLGSAVPCTELTKGFHDWVGVQDALLDPLGNLVALLGCGRGGHHRVELHQAAGCPCLQQKQPCRSCGNASAHLLTGTLWGALCSVLC